MNNIWDIKEKCYGCSACANACPKNAISMQYSKEGFLYPVIDEKKCVNCGACNNVCPHVNKKYNNESNPKCYAFCASDETRSKSTSGGAFPIIADYFIKKGGYVSGAIWNDDYTVSHIVSSDIKIIDKMRESKYLQSNIGKCYFEIKNLLDKDNYVLFTGTPCQVAGLKSFLKCDYSKLYCIDIICHGVPSPKVFEKYMLEKLENLGGKWLHTNFRDKVNGWDAELTITTKTTATTSSSFAGNDEFMQAFLGNLCLRKTCANCEFQTIPRQGDITIGDFWGIWDFDKSLNDKKGTSLVLENNKKGSELIDVLRNNAKILKNVPLKYAINGNPCLIRSVKPHKDRNLFFDLCKNKTLKEGIDICLKDKVDYLLVNFYDSVFNYGALLTAYAMQELVKSYGFTTKLLDVGYRTNSDWWHNSFMEKFTNKFLHTTNRLNYNQSKDLSKNAKGVILGSDQILRIPYIKYNMNKYLLNWVADDTRKIAISASFGIDKEEFLSENCNKDIEYMKYALNNFDYLSCREISGRKIYSDVFGLESDYILDPVFLIDRTKYDDIIKHSMVDNSNKIALHILDKHEEYNKLYDYIEHLEKTELVSINDKNYQVEDWLKSIKECKMLITDSFHGVCFAIIFNKPFICIRNPERGNARFDSLIQQFGIKDNFISSIEEINDVNNNINYEEINKILQSKIENDLQIIENVLTKNYSNNLNAKNNKIKNQTFLENPTRLSLENMKLRLNYIKCEVLANLMFGSKKEHYINKKRNLKNQLAQNGKW